MLVYIFFINMCAYVLYRKPQEQSQILNLSVICHANAIDNNRSIFHWSNKNIEFETFINRIGMMMIIIPPKTKSTSRSLFFLFLDTFFFFLLLCWMPPPSLEWFLYGNWHAASIQSKKRKKQRNSFIQPDIFLFLVNFFSFFCASTDLVKTKQKEKKNIRRNGKHFENIYIFKCLLKHARPISDSSMCVWFLIYIYYIFKSKYFMPITPRDIVSEYT